VPAHLPPGPVTLDVLGRAVAAPPFDAHRLDQVGARTAAAVGDAGTALAAVAASRGVLWDSAAGDGYRAGIDETLGRLRSLRDTLTGILDEAQALARRTWTCAPGAAPMTYVAGNWPQVSRRARFVVAPTGGGVAMRVGGASSTCVDPETLAQAAVLLGDAAAALDDAQRCLAWYTGWSAPFRAPDEVDRICGKVGGLALGPLAPRHRADDVRELAGAVQGAAQRYVDGETRAQGWTRALGSLTGWVVGENPLLSLVVLGGAARAGIGAGLMVGVASAIDPEGTRKVLGRLGGLVVSTGAVDPLVSGAAASLRAARLGPQLPTLRPVQEVSRWFTLALASLSGRVVVVPVVDPVRAPVAVGFGGALDLVARSYDHGTGDSPPGTVTVQRIDHPDGSRSWVVAIPGTEALIGEEVPFDGVSDVQLAAGVAETLTPAVMTAMERAGIPADEPVVLAGHSLGGMVATSVAWAAAGRFQVAGLITAGSPTIPRGFPPGVPAIRFEHDEDAVPHADDVPTGAGGDVSVVRRSLGDIWPAHDVAEYRSTAAQTDADLVAKPRPELEAVTALLGSEDATATTTRYQLVRQPGTADPEPGTGTGGGGW